MRSKLPLTFVSLEEGEAEGDFSGDDGAGPDSLELFRPNKSGKDDLRVRFSGGPEADAELEPEALDKVDAAEEVAEVGVLEACPAEEEAELAENSLLLLPTMPLGNWTWACEAAEAEAGAEVVVELDTGEPARIPPLPSESSRMSGLGLGPRASLRVPVAMGTWSGGGATTKERRLLAGTLISKWVPAPSSSQAVTTTSGILKWERARACAAGALSWRCRVGELVDGVEAGAPLPPTNEPDRGHDWESGEEEDDDDDPP